MDLSSPLTTITPTLDAGVLQVLVATTAGCGVGEVHRRLGRGSDEGVRKVLARLVGQGIVLVERAGRTRTYRFNRQHVAARHIEALTRVRGELVELMATELSEWAVGPLHASVFGSFARGTADGDSDIDVLLVRPAELTDEDRWLEQLGELEDRISIWTGNAAHIIDLAPANLQTMATARDPLVDSWRADHVLLHGARLLDLLRSTR